MVIHMGLTSHSTGTNVLNNDFELQKNKCNYTVAIAGNPNVRKINYF